MILAFSSSDVQIAWKTFFGLVAIFLAVRLALFLRIGWKGIQRSKVINAEIERKMAVIKNLDIQEAKRLGMEFFNQAAIKKEPWPGPIPNDLSRIIGSLDDSVQFLFGMYRKWSFRPADIEIETDFSADYLLGKPTVKSGYVIA